MSDSRQYPDVLDAYTPSGKSSFTAILAMNAAGVVSALAALALLRVVFFPLDPRPLNVFVHVLRFIGELAVFAVPMLVGGAVGVAGVFLGNRSPKLARDVAIIPTIGVYLLSGMVGDTIDGLSLKSLFFLDVHRMLRLVLIPVGVITSIRGAQSFTRERKFCERCKRRMVARHIVAPVSSVGSVMRFLENGRVRDAFIQQRDGDLAVLSETFQELFDKRGRPATQAPTEQGQSFLRLDSCPACGVGYVSLEVGQTSSAPSPHKHDKVRRLIFSRAATPTETESIAAVLNAVKKPTA